MAYIYGMAVYEGAQSTAMLTVPDEHLVYVLSIFKEYQLTRFSASD